MQSLKGYNHPVAQRESIEYPARRSYDAVAYGWSFGYGSTSDDGTGTGCGGGVPPCHLPGNSSTDFFHGNFNNIGGSIAWAPGVPHELPASFYLAGKPAWWGSMPFPATGPDVAGGSGPGGHSYGNPAQACYLQGNGRRRMEGRVDPLPSMPADATEWVFRIAPILPDNIDTIGGNASGSSARGGVDEESQ